MNANLMRFPSRRRLLLFLGWPCRVRARRHACGAPRSPPPSASSSRVPSPPLEHVPEASPATAPPSSPSWPCPPHTSIAASLWGCRGLWRRRRVGDRSSSGARGRLRETRSRIFDKSQHASEILRMHVNESEGALLAGALCEFVGELSEFVEGLGKRFDDVKPLAG